MISWIALLPLIGFLINGFWYLLAQGPAGKKNSHAAIPGAIASLFIFGSFVLSVLSFKQLLGMHPDERSIEEVLFNWIHIGSFNLDFTLRMDALSSVFALVITGVGTLIHLYSIGYMGHDEAPTKYFAYLNLFCFSMLILVLGGSLPILFLGWEGVGLCSYLLIGFWYQDEEKAIAGKKAFVVNRIGDFGFLLAMFWVFYLFGTFDFVQLKSAITDSGIMAGESLGLTIIALLFFLGCTGKSAQIPLYVWLPDAMAGPTPVSALIHAATMVTSGIYLISRMNFLFLLSPTALHVVAWVGAITACFAATMAFAQRDIKKVLAYSTVSQLGYMFLACGVGAFTAGVFHVVTHAFFKALLFLGAGSVIYGMHHEQDMYKMGGLRSKMPATFTTMFIGLLAIAGIPGLSGFWSKDEILWKSASSTLGSWPLYAVGMVTAIMTAFYMTRLMALTFFGKPRFDVHHHDAHESPAIMTVPLWILAILSALGGFMGMPFGELNFFHHWLEPVIQEAPLNADLSHTIEYGLMALSGLVAITVVGVAFKMYSNLSDMEQFKKKFSRVFKLLENKWYIDEIYEALFVKPIRWGSQMLWKYFDVAVIDWIVIGFGRVTNWAGQTLRLMQTGAIQAYAITFLIGFLLMLGWLLYGVV